MNKLVAPCSCSLSRRSFLGQSVSCGAWIASMAAFSPNVARRIFSASRDEVVVREKWGRIEKVAENIWVMISTLDEQDFTTVCNGGIVAGDKGVLVIESSMTTTGARWLSDWAEKLTGRRPSDVVATHYHADHSAGIAGLYQAGHSPNLWLTESTEKQIRQTRPDDVLPETVHRIDTVNSAAIDLGNRKINVVARSGHTNSDITLEVSDPNIIWTGDLFFNQMVPNYSDSSPAVLNEQVALLKRDAETTYIPGHGAIASATDLKTYQEFLAMIGDSAQRAFEAGQEAEAAGKEFVLPEPFVDWYIYSPQVMPNAFAAWYRHLAKQDAP